MTTAAAKPKLYPGREIRPQTGPTRSRREQRLYRQGLLFLDLFVGIIAFFAAVATRAHLPWPKGAMNGATILACALFFLLALLLAQLKTGGPKPIPETGQILRSGVLAGFLLLTGLFLFRSLGNDVSRATLVFFGAFLTAGWAAAHGALGDWHGRNLRRFPHQAVIVGDPESCRDLAAKISTCPGWQVLEIIPANPGAQTHDIETRLNRTIRDRAADTVILSSAPRGTGYETAHLHREVAKLCETTGIRLQIHAGWLDEYSNIYLDHIGTEAVLTYSFGPGPSWPLIAKRGIDITLALLTLLLTSPMLAAAALAIKIETPGPIIFTQVRTGTRGRTFKIYKLRSMVNNAEELKQNLAQKNEMDGPVFKMAQDPRITHVGRWLRKSSIDEIPQFLNVLRGEMSVVGPRPPLPSEVASYGDIHLRRLSMKPGITGAWQVMGRNQITSFEEWARLDAEYIRNWSLTLDARILLRTVAAVAKMNGR